MTGLMDKGVVVVNQEENNCEQRDRRKGALYCDDHYGFALCLRGKIQQNEKKNCQTICQVDN